MSGSLQMTKKQESNQMEVYQTRYILLRAHKDDDDATELICRAKRIEI